MRLLLAGRFRSAQADRLTFLNNLPRASESKRAGRYVLGDDRARPHIGAGPDFNRRDDRGVRADEGAFADGGAVLGVAVVIAGDGAGPDVGIGADEGIANVAQM